IDVSAGAKGDAGRETFAAGRDGAGTAPSLALEGRIIADHADGAGPDVVVRGDRAYALGSIAAATTATFTDANTVWADYNRFMANAGTVKSALAGLTVVENGRETIGAVSDAVSVRAGITIDSLPGAAPTDLQLIDAWDLTNANWNLGGVPGLLTLRATGNLDIRNSLGLPNDTSLPQGATWSLRLAGGADRTGANPLALADQSALVAAGSGDVILYDSGSTAANAPIGKVRTGSGDIEIAAGRDFVLGSTTDNRAVVYTAGIPQVDAAKDPRGRYSSYGGDIRITAQGNATGSMLPAGRAGELVNDWLRRSSAAGTTGPETIANATAGWWVSRADFRHNIGSFAGGDISVAAGGNIRNLSAVAPTSSYSSDDDVSLRLTAIVDAGGNRIHQVRGGGDLTIAAGGNIEGGEYLVAAGSGEIQSFGAVGATTPTSLFLMGDHSDVALAGATIQVEAGDGANIRNVSNPTIMPSTQAARTSGAQADRNGFDNQRSAFFSYAAESGAEILAVNGDIVVGAKSQGKPVSATGGLQGGLAAANSQLAPPNLYFAALGGNVAGDPLNSDTTISLFGGPTRSLVILAASGISDLHFSDLDVDPAVLPSWANPRSARASNALQNVLAGARLIPEASAGAIERFQVEALTGDIADAAFA
ncbi:MAG: hypothetical protein WBP72_01600, partial [Rhodocyclaceae bacterium]